MSRRPASYPSDRPGSRRSFLGDDSWLEVTTKLVTLATLGFGVWAYYHSVQPVFEKESELQRQRLRAGHLTAEVSQLQADRKLLQEQLERYHHAGSIYRRGIVLSYMSEIRLKIERDARRYAESSAKPFDLRAHSLTYADAQLKALGSPPPDSPESYRKKALLFFRSFARSLPPGRSEAGLLDRLLEAYDEQETAATEIPSRTPGG